MKLIEALKKIKYLEKKSDDLKEKIRNHSCDLDIENPMYPDQKEQVAKWIQCFTDTLHELSSIHFRIQQTNVTTKMTLELDGKSVTKSLSEWIIRRRKLCLMEAAMYTTLGSKQLKDGQIQSSSGQFQAVKVRRYYDPKLKDQKLASLTAEPYEIDGKLEIFNAVTDLVD